MDFVLDEFIIIMFFTFVITLLASSLIAINFCKFTLLDMKDFTQKKGVSVRTKNFISNYGIKSRAPEIMKEKITYFKDE